MALAVATHEPSPADWPVADTPPRLAPGVELLGPYLDSGLESPPYLVRRAGRILQISRLLYVVASAADGARTFDDIAAVAGDELYRHLTGDQVRSLVVKRLAPAGILTTEDGPVDVPEPAVSGAPATDRRLLGLRFRRAVLSPQRMDGWARRVGPLFRPAVVAAVLTGVAALDLWVFGAYSVADTFYVVSDLTGVPDILSRVGPALLSLIPGRPAHPAVAALRPNARRLLFGYLGSLVLFLAVVVVPAVLLIPRTLAANWDRPSPRSPAGLGATGTSRSSGRASTTPSLDATSCWWSCSPTAAAGPGSRPWPSDLRQIVTKLKNRRE